MIKANAIDFLAMVSEFVGTFFFLFLAYMAVNTSNLDKNNPPSGTTATEFALINTASLLYIAAAFGSAITIMIFIFGRISGALFNPSVGLALLIVGKLKPVRFVLLVISQLVAGIVAAGVVRGLVNDGLYVSNTLSPGVTIPKGLFIETFMTAQLVLTVLMMAIEKNDNVPISAFAIGLSIFVAHIGSLYYTGTGINQARTLGPEVVSGSFPAYCWIYYIGPFLGAALAAGFYIFIKGMKYEEVVLMDSQQDEILWRPSSEAVLRANQSNNRHSDPESGKSPVHPSFPNEPTPNAVT